MKTLIVQNLTHRGTVAAEGFVFSAKLLPESEMRRRILALWQPNAKIFRHRENLIVLFPNAFRVDCRRADGLPLVRYGEILASFPLRKNDLQHFQKSGATIILADAGRIETLPIRELQTENLETWFDVSDFQIVATETLGEVKTKPVVIEQTAAVDLRRELKGVPEADAEMAEILQTLRRKKDEIAQAKSHRMFRSGNASASPLAETFGGVFDALKNLFSTSGGQIQPTPDNQANPPSKLRQMFTKALFQMKIAPLVGRKQAQYLSKMMEMFENGDLENALKHAIPLEDMQSLKEMSEQLPFLGFLRPRSDLRINYGGRNASDSAVHLENQWFENLRQLYRQTFERLVVQKRYEEAAFVLAELLKSHHEAVEFLEKHGKLRLAAELAEARGLSKEIIVRQWFLAGEKRRAIQLAVLHNCFQYVVTKLEQEKHPQAAALREIWAENLAASGNFAAAVNAIWSLPDKRRIAAAWIDRIIEFGGAAAAEMLAKKITLFPESFGAVKAKLLEMLIENDAEAVENRVAFARETLRLAPNHELRTLVRPLARKLLADSANGFQRFAAPDFRQLIEVAGDYALRADLPAFKPPVENKTSEVFRLEIAAHDCGATQIFDAHFLPDGKIAVALGEAGVKIVSRQGKTVAHFDQPTEKFVASDFGTKAICLVRRGETHRLAKIDFVERKASYWCDAKIGNYAATFDGNLWFVSEKDEIYLIDTNAKNYEAAWRVPELGGAVGEIARSKNRLIFLTANEKGFEKWWYDLPSLTLRSRNQTNWLAMENENQTVHSVASFVAFSVVQIAETVENQSEFEARIYDYDKLLTKVKFPPDTLAAGKPLIVEKTFVLSRRTAKAAIISLYETPQTLLAEFVVENSEGGAIKLDEKFLTITDNGGRVIIFDYREKVLRRNSRF